MTDGERLLRRILENPADDATRLVYADYLEENGEAERAEFIRLQVELAKTPEWKSSSGPVTMTFNGKTSSATPITCRNLQHDELTKQAGRLLSNANRGRNWLPFREERISLNASSVRVVRVVCPIYGMKWSRGFVSFVRCVLEDWISHGPAIVAAHSVERVEITDRIRFQIDPTTDAIVATPDVGPLGRAAVTDKNNPIGSAALNWARREAGLPLLLATTDEAMTREEGRP